MFSVLVSMARLPGWIAKWREITDPATKIGLAAPGYTGYTKRDDIPMGNRLQPHGSGRWA
jgi:citrate synthase